MTVNLRALTGALSEHFPVRGPHVEMHLVGMEDDPELLARDGGGGHIHITARLIEWEDEGSRRRIRNIKEQEIHFAQVPDETPTERLLAYAEGTAMAMGPALAALPNVDRQMPGDFFFPRVFKLVRPRTAEDFAEALSVRSRLRRFMAP